MEDVKEILATSHDRVLLVDVHAQQKEITDERVECIPGALPVGLDELEFPFFLGSGDDDCDAAWVNPSTQQRLHRQAGNLLHAAQLRERVQAMGISSNSTVLAYSSHAKGLHGPLAATRFLWALACCQVDGDLMLIDGGLQMWKHRGWPVAMAWKRRWTGNWKDAPPVPAKLPFLATTEDVVKATHGMSESLILDVRSYLEFTGTCHDYTYFDTLGRLPNATWIDWGPSTYVGGAFFYFDAQSNATLFRPLFDIRRRWAELQIDEARYQASIFYCGSGWRSAMAWFISRLLGWQSSMNYDGGWLEYSTLHLNSRMHAYETGVPRGMTKFSKSRFRPGARRWASNADPEAPSIGERLAVAKREMLDKLQRRCHGGGIPSDAVNDAVVALGKLAGAADEDVSSRLSCDQALASEIDTRQAKSAPRWTLHDADLQLRAVIKKALKDYAPDEDQSRSLPSSRATSVGSSRQVTDTLTETSFACSPEISDADVELDSKMLASPDDKLHEAGETSLNTGLPNISPSNETSMCTFHEADLHLRQVVKEILTAHGRRHQDLPQQLARSKRESLAELKRAYGTTGLLRREAVESVIHSMRELCNSDAELI